MLAPSLKLEGLKLAGLLLVGTLLGLAGIDLILPAIPTLPQALGGSLAQAQGVLAAYSFGTGVGLILFGALLAYAAAGGGALLPYLVLFVPVNLGLGFRGPLAFMAALDAASGNDSRASALMLLAVMLLTGLGTLLAAPTLGDSA